MIDRTLGHYRILEKIGAGGMGVVYRAFDQRLERDVAMKTLPPGVLADDAARRRFRNEALTLSKLNHPNIEAVYDFDTQDGVDFLIMELIPGITLGEKLAGRSLPEKEMLDLAAQLAQGLIAAHEAGIVHRDLKPANIRITPDGRLKILDFGLAKLLRPGADLAHAETLTETKTVAGTLPYMPPEQLRAEAVDARTDIFAAGIVLYEMATGRRPFREEIAPRLIDAILHQAPASPRLSNPGLPAELERMILKCLEKAPADRYQSVTEIAVDLRRLERQSESGAAEPPAAAAAPAVAAAAPPRRARVYALFALVMIAVAVAAGLIGLERRQARRVAALVAVLEPAAAAGRLDEVSQRIETSGLTLEDLGPLAAKVAGAISIASDPPGADVTATRVSPVATLAQRPAIRLGRTPLAGRRLVAGEYLIRLAAPAGDPLELLATIEAGKELRLARSLPSEGLARVDEGAPFRIGRHEVTNAEFLKFVAAGGYRDAALWPAGTPLAKLVDRTGVPGPRHWSGGAPAPDKGPHPVTGVTWFEAAAYARWSGKDLPTADQWWRAALGSTGGVFPWGRDVRTAELRANFGLAGSQPVGSHPAGVSPFGCYDMAGNVREWLRDPAPDGKRRIVVGGSWQDPSYMFERSHEEAYDPAFASDAIGFRVVK